MTWTRRSTTKCSLRREAESTGRNFSNLLASFAPRQKEVGDGGTACLLLWVDVHKKGVTACVLWAEEKGEKGKEKREFGTMCPFGEAA